jgi:hypothetical protein
MNFLTREIVDFYKLNDRTRWYLTKFFTNTKKIGYYSPYREDAVDKKWNGEDDFLGTIDEDNTYDINGFGFRGQIDENSDILASGCSITFGLGVPESGRWTNFLSNKANKSVMNLGNPGASVESICKDIIHYCMNNKMPKEIFCLMPDFFRRMVVVDKEFYKSKIKRGEIGKIDALEYIYCNPKIIRSKDSVFMDVEDQTYIEDSVSPHQLILDSVNFISILESFCLTNNIKLYWTTWDLSTSLIMQELSNLENFKLKNFRPLLPPEAAFAVDPSISAYCDLDHQTGFENNLAWPKGTDYSIINRKKVKKWAHPGIHFQYHVADFFYNLSKEDDENN